ncbi:MFS transporter [Actinomycetaceae bacterium L2_0104]
MTPPPSTLIRRLTVAQALAVAGTTVDLTLTGIVGARLAPSAALATLPYASIFLVAGISTAFISRALTRFRPRTVFTTTALAAVASGVVSSLGLQFSSFWLFCTGTALVGIYTAGAAYYRYTAAEAAPEARARAVSTVLSGGLVAAIIGPFLATALQGLTSTPFVGSYLLVALLGVCAAVWNSRLPALTSTTADTPESGAAARPRRMRELWAQPRLWAGLVGATVAMSTMSAMMTAGPILGEQVGHSAVVTAFAVQLHMIGMYAPGFLAARIIGRVGEPRVVLAGALLIATAGITAAVGTSLALFLAAMFLVGVGWNLAYSGGSALITTAYRPNERTHVQGIAEPIIVAAQVAGAFSATAFTNASGWLLLGYLSLGLGILAALAAMLGARKIRAEAT